MKPDRANAIAAAILALLGRWLHDPALRDELVALLRDEFADVQREILRDVSDLPSE